MDDRVRRMRSQLAVCIRQFLSGHVSSDHLSEEFKTSDDSRIREALDLIEKETASIDKYKRQDRSDSEFKEKMESLARRLEET